MSGGWPVLVVATGPSAARREGCKLAAPTGFDGHPRGPRFGLLVRLAGVLAAGDGFLAHQPCCSLGAADPMKAFAGDA